MISRFIDGLTQTNHCQLRWSERFPDLDYNDELNGTRRCGRAMRKSIRSQCIHNAWKSHNTSQWAYLISKSKIVFVINLVDMAVVTVFKYVHEVTLDQFRETCKRLMGEGYSVSRIAKETGKSYTHTNQICMQEREINE